MKITSIHYEKVFPIAPYQNEKIGVEIQVGENDKAFEVFAEAKKMVERWHNENDPEYQLNHYQRTGEFYNPTKPIDKPHTDEVPIINWRGDTGMEQFENAIRDAETVEELGIIRRRTDFPATLMPLFMKKIKHLTPKTVAPY